MKNGEVPPVAQKVQVILVDDLDGGGADETVSFSLDGVSYEIDLTTDNATQLREAFAPWVGHARKVGRPASRQTRRSSPSGRSSSSGSGASPTAMREWARENGFNVNDRGRISAEVREAYEAAH